MSLSANLDSKVEAALGAALNRLVQLSARLPSEIRSGRLPHVTEKGRWEWVPFGQSGGWTGDRWSHGYWTGGFVAGQLWQASRVARQPKAFAEVAADCTRALSVRADDRLIHDVGFLFWPSAVLGALATGSEEFAALARRAANALLDRRHPSGLIQAWGEVSDPRARGSSTIDTMMNLPLLWWADRNGIPGAADAAAIHADLSAHLYVRPDGTTFHTARIEEDGSPTERGTYQGYAATSCWSRGQAWAVHGFVDAYSATGRLPFRALAERTIEAFLARLPDDGIAPWDFDDPDWRNAPRDASATAIVAAALLKLAARTGDAQWDSRWAEEGQHLTRALIDHAANTTVADGLLLRCTYSIPHRSGVSGAATWGDYFYLECLLLANHSDGYLDPVASSPD